MGARVNTAYDEVLYPTGPQARLHIENLHLCAMLNGYQPAAVETARVLEIGCGSGFNLIPMALETPGASFTGIDYAARPIALGQDVASQLGLRNLELHCADISQPGLELCEYDYIIAHGLYSWVPDSVRQALWELVRRILAPRGVFHVSYNALPGWYPTFAIRDFLRIVTERESHPRKKLDVAWDALGLLANHRDTGNVLAIEASRIRSNPKEVLFHDELGDETEPFYLTHIVDRAREAGFRYIAEADLRSPAGLHTHPPIAQLLMNTAPEDLLMRSQLRDYMSLRRFHDSLFTRESHEPGKVSISASLASVWAWSDIRLAEQAEDGERTYVHSRTIQLTTSHPLVCALADALQAAAPGSISLAAFWEELQRRHPEMHPGLTSQYWPLVQQLMEGGVLRLRLRQVPVAGSLGARPRTSHFTRIHAQWDACVANAYHSSSEVPEAWQRLLLTLLDGTRDRQQLLDDLSNCCWEELQSGKVPGHTLAAMPYHIASSPSFQAEPLHLGSAATLRAFFAGKIDEVLRVFWLAGYLV